MNPSRDFLCPSGYLGASQLLDLSAPPTGIFCYNDRVAMGVYDALHERGVRIPDDVAVVGFDNQEVIAAHLRPPLSTMALPHYDMGFWGVKYLLSHHHRRRQPSPDRRAIECPYVERLSV
jgi:LacI family transcriptional regulator